MTGGDFGLTVRQALRERKISMRAAARMLSYDHAFLSRVLSGKQLPSPQLVQALDNLLGAEGTLVELAAPLSDPDVVDRVERVVAQPSRLDARTVGALADVLAAQRRLDDAVGPTAVLPATQAQASTVRSLLRSSGGPHRGALADVVAEWVQFEGWLHASARSDARALILLDEAVELADEAESGTLVAQALNFRGYVARQREQPRAVTRWFSAAYHTPGAHPAQRMGDATQAAHGYAELGHTDEARRMLDEAANLADAAADQPPGTAYWLTPTFQRLSLGLAHLGLGEHADAAEHLRAGLSGLPADQQRAEWTGEYRDALEVAEAA
ncbi:helix-turn-helix transcriptional regulator [Streptomyces sp. ITFR-6]|uniref:helix-turn-helix domain-containing protein n=1 Tax=Streptomyces sp. ITFR-6 TaxID=3075197 RepID=UPI00288B89DE|nr:helix-turn-helix transcriptional regulator [Streptomyces sp. ITFR-6]WNI28597.1 helix-turn-helix transcriptional regulator [Streptomyces sp. ITFR-6]